MPIFSRLPCFDDIPAVALPVDFTAGKQRLVALSAENGASKMMGSHVLFFLYKSDRAFLSKHFDRSGPLLELNTCVRSIAPLTI